MINSCSGDKLVTGLEKPTVFTNTDFDSLSAT
jgi:hypothetical protein